MQASGRTHDAEHLESASLPVTYDGPPEEPAAGSEYRRWACGCVAFHSGAPDRALTFDSCPLHTNASAGPDPANFQPLKPAEDATPSEDGLSFFVVDRSMRLLSVSQHGEVEEYLAVALERLAPYAGGALPSVISLGTEGLLHTSTLHRHWAGATIVFHEPPRARTALRRSAKRYGLTAREAEVLSLLTLTTEEIAKRLHIERSTVSDHIASLLRKMECSRRAQLVQKMFSIL